jgi:hypothetical protein
MPPALDPRLVMPKREQSRERLTRRPAEAALQHLRNLAGKVRQRAIGERESGGIEHRDLIAGDDERRAGGIGGRACKRVEGEQPIAANKIHGVPAAGKIDRADDASADDVGQRGASGEELNRGKAEPVDNAGIGHRGIARVRLQHDGATGSGIDYCSVATGERHHSNARGAAGIDRGSIAA